MEIRTKYDIGQTVYVKTDRYSAEEEVDCPICKGVGEFKADLKFEDGIVQDVPVRCTECEGTGKIIAREPLVMTGTIDRIETTSRQGRCAIIYYDVRLRGGHTLTDIIENHVYLTREEAEAGVTV